MKLFSSNGVMRLLNNKANDINAKKNHGRHEAPEVIVNLSTTAPLIHAQLLQEHAVAATPAADHHIVTMCPTHDSDDDSSVEVVAVVAVGAIDIAPKAKKSVRFAPLPAKETNEAKPTEQAVDDDSEVTSEEGSLWTSRAEGYRMQQATLIDCLDLRLDSSQDFTTLVDRTFSECCKHHDKQLKMMKKKNKKTKKTQQQQAITTEVQVDLDDVVSAYDRSQWIACYANKEEIGDQSDSAAVEKANKKKTLTGLGLERRIILVKSVARIAKLRKIVMDEYRKNRNIEDADLKMAEKCHTITGPSNQFALWKGQMLYEAIYKD